MNACLSRRHFLGFLTAALLVSCGGDTRPPLVFEPADLPKAHLGQTYTIRIQVRQNQTPVFAMGVDPATLPPGLSLIFEEGSDSAVITGVPTQQGQYRFMVDASCFGTNVSGQTGQHTYVIDVE